MFTPLRLPTLVLLLLAMAWAFPKASIWDAGKVAQPQTMADEIPDPAERTLFLRVWNAADAKAQRDLAARFVAQYPRSIVLRETYEIAARASLRAGDGAGALDWGRRALRLLPENAPLLVIVADLAAKQREPALAERTARAAIRLLETAVAPPPLTSEQWTQMRRDFLATAYAVLGRVGIERGDHAGAERSLLAALGLAPTDLEAAYLLGVTRVAARRDDEAAPPLSLVARSGGALADAARRLLREIYARKASSLANSFDTYVASLRFVPPQPPAAPSDLVASHPYAGSDACRSCHVREYERWQATGMAKMLRSYKPENVVGDFSSGQTVSGSARAVLDGGRHFIEVRRGDTQDWTRYPVDYTIGSKWQQAYATRLADQRLLVFPIQYSRRSRTWLNYWKLVDAPDSARADIARFHEFPREAIYQTTCAPCHTSQLTFDKGGQPAAATFHEGGINCEMCHGPSRTHVEGMKTGRPVRGAASDPPVRFAGLKADESVAICAQCHAQSAMHDAAASGEVNFARTRSLVPDLPDAPAIKFPAPCALPRRPVPRDHVHQRGVRSNAVLSGWRRHVRVVPQSASAGCGGQPDVPEVRGRRRPDVRPVPYRLQGRARPAHSPRRRQRSEPLRQLSYAAHRRGPDLQGAIASDRRDPRCGDDRALRRRRQSERVSELSPRQGAGVVERPRWPRVSVKASSYLCDAWKGQVDASVRRRAHAERRYSPTCRWARW